MAYRHYLQEHTIKEDSDCFLIGDIDEEIDFEGDLRFVFGLFVCFFAGRRGVFRSLSNECGEIF